MTKKTTFMTTGIRSCAKHWLRTTAVLWMLLLPISMTGCGRRYVVIEGDQNVTVKKSTIDRLYSDNENLLRALKKCQEGKDK